MTADLAARDLVHVALGSGRDNAEPICSIEGCGRPLRARGWCATHWSRWNRHGVVGPPQSTRKMGGFWGKVEVQEGCWNWTGATSGGGYGRFQRRPAHRVSWEMVNGPWPSDMQADHLCRNRRCVRPDHIEPVTSRVNVRRSLSPPAINARKHRCIHGHVFTTANTYVTVSGKRRCRTCQRSSDQRRRNPDRRASISEIRRAEALSRYRQALHLAMQGRTRAEIAKVFGVTAKTVTTWHRLYGRASA